MAVSRRRFFELCGLGALGALGLAGCDFDFDDPLGQGSAHNANNAKKPVVFFNRQPIDADTEKIDMKTLGWNSNTYYVGVDAQQGGELQGQMIADYITAHIDEIDRGKDGVIGYVLAIGDVEHNDSLARTRGVRKALGTAVEVDGAVCTDPIGINDDGSSDLVQDGKLKVGDKTYTIRELASQEMKGNSGTTWDANTAGNAIKNWAEAFGDEIDLVISNNDGMGVAMFDAWSNENKVPTFGYDATEDAIAAFEDGYAGTISQNPAVQAYLTLRLLRNAIDGVDIETGISTPDDAGNVLIVDDFTYVEEERSYYATNLKVTEDNYDAFSDATSLYASARIPIEGETKKLWLCIYNAFDDFLSTTYQPLLEAYDDILKLDIDYIGGDGQTESNITNRMGNPDEYDGYAINMVKTTNGPSYTALLA